jgi:hypothetical protein
VTTLVTGVAPKGLGESTPGSRDPNLEQPGAELWVPALRHYGSANSTEPRYPASGESPIHGAER